MDGSWERLFNIRQESHPVLSQLMLPRTEHSVIQPEVFRKSRFHIKIQNFSRFRKNKPFSKPWSQALSHVAQLVQSHNPRGCSGPQTRASGLCVEHTDLLHPVPL